MSLQVPLVDTATDIQSFRLQNLRPATVYVSQVSCKNAREGHGYWSAWSANATAATTEDREFTPPLPHCSITGAHLQILLSR